MFHDARWDAWLHLLAHYRRCGCGHPMYLCVVGQEIAGEQSKELKVGDRVGIGDIRGLYHLGIQFVKRLRLAVGFSNAVAAFIRGVQSIQIEVNSEIVAAVPIMSTRRH
ncbi:hypothetical protein PRNP1_015092 [Phytophthora ramorum]